MYTCAQLCFAPTKRHGMTTAVERTGAGTTIFIVPNVVHTYVLPGACAAVLPPHTSSCIDRRCSLLVISPFVPCGLVALDTRSPTSRLPLRCGSSLEKIYIRSAVGVHLFVRGSLFVAGRKINSEALRPSTPKLAKLHLEEKQNTKILNKTPIPSSSVCGREHRTWRGGGVVQSNATVTLMTMC